MSVIPKLLAKRVSETTITIIDSSRLSYYPITEWDIRVIIVLWVLFFITLVFVVLRLYSRVRVLQFYALEDYLYNIAFVSRPFSCSPFSDSPSDPLILVYIYGHARVRAKDEQQSIPFRVFCSLFLAR